MNNSEINIKYVVEQMIEERSDDIFEGVNIVIFNLIFNYILKEQEINSAYENYKEVIKLLLKDPKTGDFDVKETQNIITYNQD